LGGAFSSEWSKNGGRERGNALFFIWEEGEERGNGMLAGELLNLLIRYKKDCSVY
jgi:hypothetical protein